MSLAENYAAERQARLVRLGRNPNNPVPTKKAGPQVQRSINAESFYPQMWFYDLVKQPKRQDQHHHASDSPRAMSDISASRQKISTAGGGRLTWTVCDRSGSGSPERTRAPALLPSAGPLETETTLRSSTAPRKIARILPHDRLVSADIAHLEAML
jgi:hypothetical protein